MCHGITNINILKFINKINNKLYIKIYNKKYIKKVKKFIKTISKFKKIAQFSKSNYYSITIPVYKSIIKV